MDGYEKYPWKSGPRLQAAGYELRDMNYAFPGGGFAGGLCRKRRKIRPNQTQRIKPRKIDEKTKDEKNEETTQCRTMTHPAREQNPHEPERATINAMGKPDAERATPRKTPPAGKTSAHQPVRIPE